MRAVLVAAVGAVALTAPGSALAAPLKAADAPASQLDRFATTTLPGGTVISNFNQSVDGVPVRDASVVVADPRGEAPSILTDGSVAGIQDPAEPAVSRVGAIAAALAAIDAPGRGTSAARLVIAADEGNQLAWEVTHYTARPASDWLVIVGADSGAVLAKYDRLKHEDADAQLFVPNPVVSSGSYDGLRDRQDQDSANLTAARVPVTMEDIKDGQTCLNGSWANVKVSSNAKKVCKDSLDWTGVTRSKSKFEALMAYHHITEAQQYIQTIGTANEEPQDVVANSIPDDNSFYSPSRDMIELGTGGVDDGEDADVIIHEYGHAVQDAQAPGSFDGNQGGAMGEGFGDYLADAYSTETVGFDAEFTPCVMEWDATSYDTRSYPGDDGDNLNDICLRRADDPSRWPKQKKTCGGAGNIHCVGEIWASALLELRTQLGDDGGGDSIVDKLVIASHDILNGNTNATFEEAAEAVLDADDTIYGGANCSDIAAEFQDRKFGTFNC